jgi:hypothetical protein
MFSASAEIAKSLMSKLNIDQIKELLTSVHEKRIRLRRPKLVQWTLEGARCSEQEVEKISVEDGIGYQPL